MLHSSYCHAEGLGPKTGQNQTSATKSENLLSAATWKVLISQGSSTMFFYYSSRRARSYILFPPSRRWRQDQMPLRPRRCAFRSWSRAPSSPFLPFTASISFGRSAKFASTWSSDHQDPQDLELARTWLKAFESGVKSIPRHVGQVSFSRSSGPGGQNVNKSVQIRSVRTHNFCRAS